MFPYNRLLETKVRYLNGECIAASVDVRTIHFGTYNERTHSDFTADQLYHLPVVRFPVFHLQRCINCPNN